MLVKLLVKIMKSNYLPYVALIVPIKYNYKKKLRVVFDSIRLTNTAHAKVCV